MKNRNKHLVKKCNVIRNGDNLKEINNNELVVGDLLIFK
jgi:Ca2+-transporting ATPase